MRVALAGRWPLRQLVERAERSAPLSRVLRGAGLAMGVRVAGAALALLTQVALARWMGAFEYGIYLFAWSCVIFLALIASLGLDRAAVRFLPEYMATDRSGHVAGVIRSFSWLVWAGGIASAGAWCLGVFLLADRIPPYYVVPLYAASLSIPFFAQINLHAEMARGFAWVGLAYAPGTILRQLLLLACVGALVLAGWPRTGTHVLVAACLATLACALLQGLVFRRRLPSSYRRARPVYQTRHWLRIALPLFLSGGAVVLMVNTDILVLGALRTPGDVAAYGAAARIAYVAAFLFFAMSVLSVPQFAALHGQGKRDELRALLQSVIRWTFWPSLLVVVGLLALGKPLLELFGPEFTAGYPALAILASASLLRALTGPVGELLHVSGNQDAAALALGTAALGNVALNFVLIPPYGPAGAALATSLSWILLRLCFVILVKRRLGFLPLLAARS